MLMINNIQIGNSNDERKTDLPCKTAVKHLQALRIPPTRYPQKKSQGSMQQNHKAENTRRRYEKVGKSSITLEQVRRDGRTQLMVLSDPMSTDD